MDSFSDFRHQQFEKKVAMSDEGSFDQLDLEIKSKAEKLDAWCPKKAMEKGWGGPKLTKETATQVAPAKDWFDQLKCSHDLRSHTVSQTNNTLPYPLSQDSYLAFPWKVPSHSQWQKCSKIHPWVPHGCVFISTRSLAGWVVGGFESTKTLKTQSKQENFRRWRLLS